MLETTFEIPSTDKRPFVALLSPFKSHGSFFLRARQSDVGKTQLPICRGCVMFANAKQRLKNETTQTLEGRLTDLLSGTSNNIISVCVFVSATRQLIIKPLSLPQYSTLMFRGLVGNRVNAGNSIQEDKARSVLTARLLF